MCKMKKWDAVDWEKSVCRERGSGFSLGFRQIGPSVFDGARRKLFYAARATRGHQFGGVPITPRGRNLFLFALIFG